MLFLLSLLLLMIISIYFFLLTKGRVQPLFFLPGLFVSFGVVSLMGLDVIKLPYGLFFFLAGVLAFIPLVWVIRSDRSVRNVILGWIGILASALIVFDVVDNYLFFRDKETSGFINPRFVKNNDTPCDNEVMIYIAKKGHDWYYRCPKMVAPGLFIVIGNQFDEPLIPWPSYYSGKSKAIERALHSR